MSKNTGIPYEILTQQIFQALHDQDQIKNINVQQNVELQGKTIKHQIDVYWEYELGGIKYCAIVQAKDWAQAVTQNHLLAFKAILDDLPGQPRGIFVTRTGYQSGAKIFAKANGIALYELREPTAKDMDGKIKTIHLKMAAFMPDASNTQPIADQAWIDKERQRLALPADQPLAINFSAPEDQLFLFNETGEKVGSFRTALASMFPDNYVEIPKTIKEHLFTAPTFILTGNPRFPKIKLLGIRSTISITRVEHETIFNGEDFIGLIMYDVIGKKNQLIDKQNQPIKKSGQAPSA